MSRESVNDIYDDSFASDGVHDDIYDGEIIESDVSRDSEYSFDPERDSFGSARTSERESDSRYARPLDSMPPPPSKSSVEMELRKLEKNELIKKYLELDATEKELRKYNRGIILENKALKEDIEILLHDMTKQNATIDVLKMGKERVEKEKHDLNIKYEVLKVRVSELESKMPIQGGNNKRIKNVSKRSTASHYHATRRHASKRKKSGTLRRMQR